MQIQRRTYSRAHYEPETLTELLEDDLRVAARLILRHARTTGELSALVAQLGREFRTAIARKGVWAEQQIRQRQIDNQTR